MSEYIDRESAVNIPVKPEEYRSYKAYDFDRVYEDGWNDAIECIKSIPAADVKPVKRGRWIDKQNPQWKAYSHDCCSICGWWNTRNARCYGKNGMDGHSLNYCPNCGADMRPDGVWEGD